MADVWRCRDREVLHDGPAGTGKTRGLLEKALVAAINYPGCRILLCRKTRASMTESVLTTFEMKVLPENSPLLGGSARDHRSHYDLPNGSRIVIGGLDNPDRIMSTEYDLIIVFEATEAVEDDFEKLTTRLRNGVMPYQQIIADCNPAAQFHWLYQRAIAGKMTRIVSRHTDNPVLWDDLHKRWTPSGESYLETLGNLSGSRKERLLKGLWVSDENSVFDLDVLLKRRNRDAQEPWHVGTLLCTEEHQKTRDQRLRRRDTSIIKWVDAPPGLLPGRTGGEWKLWCDLYPDPKTGKLRPERGLMAVLAADVSWGQGASNSVIMVGDRNTGRKIAEFTSANIAPEDFARILVMAGYWFGGAKGYGFLGWEYNGAGKSVTKIAAHTLSYPWCYEHKSRKRGRAESAPKAVVGWVSSREAKIDLALELRDAYAQDEFFNPSKASFDETMAWVRYRSGGIGPASMMEESPEAQQTHGDRTVGDMILWHMMQVCPMFTPKAPEPEKGSILDRQREELEADPDEDG